MKKALSIILVLALACSLFGGAALAASSDYALTGGSVTVDGTTDKTVDVVFTSVPGGMFKSFEADWSLKEKESSSYLTLSALTSEKEADAMENDPATGRVIFFNSNFTNDSYNLNVAANGAIWTATYTVDKNTPTGKYTVSLDVNGITDSNGDAINEAMTSWTATITVTNNSAPAANGYTVTVEADKTTVATGETVLISLDVTNSDSAVTNFYVIDLALTYDSTDFTYDATNSTLPTGLTANASNGTLTVQKYGDAIALQDGAEFKLAFTAGNSAAENCEFKVTMAKIDIANHANQDAPEATVSGTPKVTVSQTYTVTFAGGAGATGTAPTQEPVPAGTEITLPTNTFAKDGYTFAGWKCNVDNAIYAAGDPYTVNGEVIFTAEWTENAPTPTATASVSGYFDGYTLIKVTTENATQTPTYGETVMFKVQNVGNQSFYDENAYYYVVSGTITAEQAQEKLGWSDTAAATLKKDGDANQTGRIDINDAQFIYNLYNGVSVSYTPTAAQLLASDVNGDGKVDTDDCAAAIAAIQ